jgi:sigma-B regulation protein RsbU (phosphoserine phosphatase)
MELAEWDRTRRLDLEAAQLTQRAILPVRQPQIAGWETAAHYQPVIQVGGDMYDWVRLSDGQWLFWMSDATGHGASAALLTALAKLVFRHAASESSRPGEIMRAVNAEFHSTLRGKSFMTAACVVVQPGSGRLVFSGAGHPPLLVRRREGAMESLRSQSPPLGILGSQQFSETSVELAPGELALLYTDGLYSVPDGDGGHLNPDDLDGVLPKQPAGAEEFVRLSVEHLTGRLAGTPLPDDLALVALRRL